MQMQNWDDNTSKLGTCASNDTMSIDANDWKYKIKKKNFQFIHSIAEFRSFRK